MPFLISPCLWFDDRAEEAAQFYTSIFKNSKITSMARYPESATEVTGKKAGSVMTVAFELDGQSFTALNGGPTFQFNEAISLQIECETQAEVDYYWEKLSEGGDPEAQRCGWLKDKFGVSWQVVPSGMEDIFGDPDSKKADRAFRAMLPMTKLDGEALRRAAAGD
jgi:predicted 3-demethylubiquinone-9 3-methyltransferase (glyoxalase superfamily)